MNFRDARYVIVSILLVFFSRVVCSESLAKTYPHNIESDLKNIHTALKLFKQDTGRFPSNIERLSVLVVSTMSKENIIKYRNGGYIPKSPNGDWIAAYDYVLVSLCGEDNYFIWRTNSEKKLGYTAGSWAKTPKKCA